jgi:hypothetical protein
MDDDVIPLAGAVSGLRMLADGDVAVTLHFEAKDRARVMTMLGAPGQPVAVVALKAGHAAQPAAAPATYRDFGPICREAIDLCGNGRFREWVSKVHGYPGGDDHGAKTMICNTCNVDSRKELDTAEGARELFIAHVRKPFHAWLDMPRQEG